MSLALFCTWQELQWISSFWWDAASSTVKTSLGASPLSYSAGGAQEWWKQGAEGRGQLQAQTHKRGLSAQGNTQGPWGPPGEGRMAPGYWPMENPVCDLLRETPTRAGGCGAWPQMSHHRAGNEMIWSVNGEEKNQGTEIIPQGEGWWTGPAQRSVGAQTAPALHVQGEAWAAPPAQRCNQSSVAALPSCPGSGSTWLLTWCLGRGSRAWITWHTAQPITNPFEGFCFSCLPLHSNKSITTSPGQSFKPFYPIAQLAHCSCWQFLKPTFLSSEFPNPELLLA